MTIYVMAQLSMVDREAYDRYQSQFMAVFRKFNGQLLVADEAPSLIEGACKPDKVVIMSFPAEEDFIAFHESPEYQTIAKDRRAGSVASILLLQGIQL